MLAMTPSRRACLLLAMSSLLDVVGGGCDLTVTIAGVLKAHRQPTKATCPMSCVEAQAAASRSVRFRATTEPQLRLVARPRVRCNLRATATFSHVVLTLTACSQPLARHSHGREHRCVFKWQLALARLPPCACFAAIGAIPALLFFNFHSVRRASVPIGNRGWCSGPQTPVMLEMSSPAFTTLRVRAAWSIALLCLPCVSYGFEGRGVRNGGWRRVQEGAAPDDIGDPLTGVSVALPHAMLPRELAKPAHFC